MSATITANEKAALTRKVLQVLRSWRVEPMDQSRLLGLPEREAGRRFRRCRLGASLPDTPEVWTRVAFLLRIDIAVNQLFPHSALSAGLWVTTPRVKFGNETPLELMLAHGLEGIRQVDASLDNLDPL